MDTEKQNKLIDDLISDLSSKDSKNLASALKRVRSKGSEKVIPALVSIIENNEEPKLVEEAKSIILELQS